MSAFGSTVAAYVLVGVLLWGYAGLLVLDCVKARRREKARR